MGIGKAKFKGKVRIRGRPMEQAQAEIMLMRARERYEDKQRRRKFFIFLDVVAILSLILGGCLILYFTQYTLGAFFVLLSLFVLFYFTYRNQIRKYQNFSRPRKYERRRS